MKNAVDGNCEHRVRHGESLSARTSSVSSSWKRENLRSIAISRTPHTQYTALGSSSGRRCVVTVGSEDLRIFVCAHKAPVVIPLQSLDARTAAGGDGRRLELRRRGLIWTSMRYLCCCEPFTHVVCLCKGGDSDALSAALLPPKIKDPDVWNPVDLRPFRLEELPTDVLYNVASFVSVPMVHESMRACSYLRAQLGGDAFWHRLYVSIPERMRSQIDEFSAGTDGNSYADKVALAYLRFCQGCHSRRQCLGPCPQCGTVPLFDAFVHFDLRAFEKLRLRLGGLRPSLSAHNFDLQTARLRFSSKHHGSSLRSLLRQVSLGGPAHLLVCEGSGGEVFGAYLGFPLKRRSASAYGVTAKTFLFDLGSRKDPQLRVFPGPTHDAAPAYSLADSFALCLEGEEPVLGLDASLRQATCNPSTWCHGASLAGTETPLASVAVFSMHEEGDGVHDDTADRHVSYVLTFGTDPEVERNVARLLLEVGSIRPDLRHYFD